MCDNGSIAYSFKVSNDQSFSWLFFLIQYADLHANVRLFFFKGQDVMSTWETKIVCKTVKIEYDRTSEPFTKPDMSTTIVSFHHQTSTSGII